MIVKQNLRMDLCRCGCTPMISAVQGEANTRVIVLALYANGTAWDIPDGSTAVVAFQKPDGKKGIYDKLPDGSAAVTLADSVAEATLAPQVLTAAGRVTVSVNFYDKDGDTLATFPFTVAVAPNPAVDAEASEDYFNYVNPLITEALEEAGTAAAAATAAAARANAASSVAYEADEKVEVLREVVSKLHSNIVETARGEVITLSDSAEAPIQGLKIFGRTTQNGIPSPEAPAPLESTGGSGSIKVTACGRNMLPFPYANSSGTIKGIEYTVGEDGSVATKGTAGDNPVFILIQDTTTDIVYPKGTYFLSGCPAGGSISTYSITLRSADKSKNDSVQDTGNGALFVLTEASKLHCTIFIKQGTNADGLVFKPMLSAGSSAMPYERKPFQFLEVPTPNGLPGNPVSSDGQQWACDAVDFEKGQYIRRIKTVVFDGNTIGGIEPIGINGISYNRVYKKVTDHDPKYRWNVLSDHFRSGYELIDYGTVSITSNGYLMFYLSESMQNLDDAKVREWFTKNPVTVQYVLAEENPIELTADELGQFAALRSCYPNTTVYNDADAYMEVSYIADTKLYVDKKFDQLAKAMLNQ